MYDKKKSINLDGSDGETREALVRRALQWWQDLVHRVQGLSARDTPYAVLAVTHGGFISKLVQALIETGFMASDAITSNWTVCMNASVTTICIQQDGKAVLEKYGDVSHLLSKNVEAVAINVDEVKSERAVA